MTTFAAQKNLTCHIDWLKFRIQEVKLNDLLAVMHLVSDVFITAEGHLIHYKDYDHVYSFENMKIYYCYEWEHYQTQYDYCVEMSGKACRAFDKVLADNNDDWKTFISNLMRFKKLDIRRIDVNIDDFNDSPYFTPVKLFNYFEADKVKYGQTTIYNPVGSEKTGMTLYIGSARSDRKMYVYDKLKERLNKQGGVMTEDLNSWIRTEVRFQADAAKVMAKDWVLSDDSLMTFFKKYLNYKVKFFVDETKKVPKAPQWWSRFISISEESPLIVPHANADLKHKINWTIIGGAITILKAYDFLQNYGLLPDFQAEDDAFSWKIGRTVQEAMDNAKYTPELADLLISEVYQSGQTHLIQEIKDDTRQS